jgi:hypothetical protein
MYSIDGVAFNENDTILKHLDLCSVLCGVGGRGSEMPSSTDVELHEFPPNMDLSRRHSVNRALLTTYIALPLNKVLCRILGE